MRRVRLRKRWVADFTNKYGDKAEVKRSVWGQIYAQSSWCTSKMEVLALKPKLRRAIIP